MKRSRPCVSIIAAALVAASGATSSAQTHPAAKSQAAKRPAVQVAPADEYFGRLKMSILGIANTIKDNGLKYDRQPESFPQLEHSVELAEDAIHDWERKYPKDPWVAKTLFALERFYQKVANDEGRAKAKATMQWLVRDFPATWYGRTGKRELAEGKVGAPPTPAATAVDPPAPADVAKPEPGADQK